MIYNKLNINIYYHFFFKKKKVVGNPGNYKLQLKLITFHYYRGIYLHKYIYI